MAKLTIELVENQYALYDVTATLNGNPLISGENYTSEEAALADVQDMVETVWGLK